MTSLSDDNQADIIEAFNSTSRYLDIFLHIDNIYFEGMVNLIYPPELQSISNCFVSSKIMINVMTLILIL